MEGTQGREEGMAVPTVLALAEYESDFDLSNSLHLRKGSAWCGRTPQNLLEGAVIHPGMGFSLNPSGQALRSVAGLPFYNERANVIFNFVPADSQAVLAISIHEAAHMDVHYNTQRQKREHH
jgi:hypothetical protein